MDGTEDICAVSGVNHYLNKEKEELWKRIISFITQKGSVNHNGRKFHAKNTNSKRNH